MAYYTQPRADPRFDPRYDRRPDPRAVQNPGYDPRYYQSPPVTMQPKQKKQDWRSGLFDCSSDMSNCCTVYCFGGINPAYLAHELGRFNENPCLSSLAGGGLTTLLLRYRLRHNQNIEGSLMKDFCVAACCLPCAQCQIARELKMIEEEEPEKLPNYRLRRI